MKTNWLILTIVWINREIGVFMRISDLLISEFFWHNYPPKELSCTKVIKRKLNKDFTEDYDERKRISKFYLVDSRPAQR